MQEINPSIEGSKSEADLFYGQLETLFILVNTLLRETSGYFHEYRRELVPEEGLLTKLSKINTSSNQILSYFSKIGESFNYLTRIQIDTLKKFVIKTDELLEEFGSTLFDAYFTTSKDQLKNSVYGIYNEIVDATNAITPIFNNLVQNYTPAITRKRLEGGGELGYKLGMPESDLDPTPPRFL